LNSISNDRALIRSDEAFVPASQVGKIDHALVSPHGPRGKSEFVAEGIVFTFDLRILLSCPVDRPTDIREHGACDRRYRDWYDHERRRDLDRHEIILPGVAPAPRQTAGLLGVP
jgi:hypothetical protein